MGFTNAGMSSQFCLVCRLLGSWPETASGKCARSVTTSRLVWSGRDCTRMTGRQEGILNLALLWAGLHTQRLTLRAGFRRYFRAADHAGGGAIFVNVSAFLGTNPTGELITFGLPVTTSHSKCGCH